MRSWKSEAEGKGKRGRQMNFMMVLVAIWAAFMLAWFVVSKYVKSSDLDRIKARLSGTGKAKKGKTAKVKGEASVMQQDTGANNRVAQKIVDRFQLGPKIAILLEQAGMRWAPARLVHTCILGFMAGFILGWMLTSSLLVAMGLGAAASAGPIVFIWRKRKARLHRFEELFPDALEFVSRSMRAGGNLAEILAKLAYVIRERFKLRGRIRAVSAHGKMTATALSSIPIAVAVLMFFTNPDYVKFFFKDETGQIMMGSAIFLQLVGYLI